MTQQVEEAGLAEVDVLVAGLGPGGCMAALLAHQAGLSTLAVEAEGIRHRIAFSGAELTVPALLTAINRQAEVRDLALTEPAIEDLVRQIYARDRR